MTSIAETAQGRLKSLVERIERLEEDKKAVTADLGEVYSEAKGEGFDVKILRKVIKLRGQDPAKRLEEEALIELYLTALGVPKVDRPAGAPAPTPLEAAIASKKPAAAVPPGRHNVNAEPPVPVKPPEPESIETARSKGAAAAKAHGAITTNPYLPGTPQRAAWDEAWCAESGSDGMDIPDAWKPGGKT